MAYSVVQKALVGMTYWVFEKYRVNDNCTENDLEWILLSLHTQEKIMKATGN